MVLKTMLCTLGKFDIPITQMQSPFNVDLLDSNIILFGSALSGKTDRKSTRLNSSHA